MQLLKGRYSRVTTLIRVDAGKVCAKASLLAAVLHRPRIHSVPFPSQVIGAISNLALDDRGEDAFLEAGAVPLVVAALDTHAADPAVVANACDALRNVSAADVAHRSAAIRAGAVEVLEMLAQRYSEDSGNNETGESVARVLNLLRL